MKQGPNKHVKTPIRVSNKVPHVTQIAAKIIIVGNQPNYHQENEQSSTSQSRTVSLSLVPHLATVQRLDVSFKPIVSTSKSRKYLKEVPIIKLDYSSFKT